MIYKEQRRNGYFLNLYTIWLTLICMCAFQVSPAQDNELRNLKISDDVERHFEDADVCRHNNDFDCARAALKNTAGLELSRFEQYQYWIRLGYVEFLDGKFHESLEAYKNAARYSPATRQREYHLRTVAQLHASLGQFQDAYDTLEQLFSGSGNGSFPRQYQLRSIAQQQADIEKFQDAYDTLEELLVRNGVEPLAWRHLTDDALWRGLDIYVTGDRNLVPLVANHHAYPRAAVVQGLSQGFVDLEFIVSRTGSTKDIRVVESSAPVFESSAIEAARVFRYKPRLVDGKPVETVVQRRIEYWTE